MLRRTAARRTLAALTLFAAATAPAVAQTSMTASLWVGPKHPVAVGAYDPLIERLEADGAFEVRYFQGGALLGAKPTLSGLGDGIADVGMLGLTYFPAELPHAQVVAEMGMATPGSLVAMAAMTEFNLLHCEPCLAEFAEQNLVYTGTYSTAPYRLISNEPIRTMEDLEGKKFRSPGSLWSRWVQSVGGVEVNVPASEMFEGLDKGALDIAIQAPGALRSYSLWDTAEYMIDLNLGTYHSLALYAFNQDFWSNLTDEQRRMLLDEAARAAVETSFVYLETDEEVIAEAADHGVTVIEAPQAMIDAKVAFVEADLPTMVEVARSEYGIEDASGMIDTMQELLDKWEGIIAEVGEDNREGLIERLKSEVYDKLPDDYGVAS
ncbi:C4-dicarboxylate TRAP transporter substrate-binding protein [Acuticoccus sp.]|uniref:C4-dicarboxylate TRAP transporter substrate-binding protein n=1 Tax=Acuticoccus sp. TaxID=1904378 RepID=UPI003B52B3E0